MDRMVRILMAFCGMIRNILPYFVCLSVCLPVCLSVTDDRPDIVVFDTDNGKNIDLDISLGARMSLS